MDSQLGRLGIEQLEGHGTQQERGSQGLQGGCLLDQRETMHEGGMMDDE